MKKVYIAGPYTKGDIALNVRHAILKADLLADAGFVPFIPHLSHFWHMLCPRDYNFWLKIDKEWLKCCDAVLRLIGESPGADEEVELAKSLNIPVFNNVTELMKHFKE